MRWHSLQLLQKMPTGDFLSLLFPLFLHSYYLKTLSVFFHLTSFLLTMEKWLFSRKVRHPRECTCYGPRGVFLLPAPANLPEAFIARRVGHVAFPRPWRSTLSA
jgi:hypothetical protein